jgi:hypothetical protein
MRVFVAFQQQSSKNMPSHKTLKFRCAGAGGRGPQGPRSHPGRRASCSCTCRAANALLAARGDSGLACRQEGQNTVAELAKEDLRGKLEDKERAYFIKVKGIDFEGERCWGLWHAWAWLGHMRARAHGSTHIGVA